MAEPVPPSSAAPMAMAMAALGTELGGTGRGEPVARSYLVLALRETSRFLYGDKGGDLRERISKT